MSDPNANEAEKNVGLPVALWSSVSVVLDPLTMLD